MLGAAVRLAVIKVMRVKSKGLIKWRRSQLERLKDVLAPTVGMTEEVRRLRGVQSTVRAVAGGINVVAMAVITLAMEWPDELLAQGLLDGFRVVGALQDTGVFRAIEPHMSMEEFQGVWRESMSPDATIKRVRDVARRIEQRAKGLSPQGLQDCKTLAKKGRGGNERELLQQEDVSGRHHPRREPAE
jgi:hypothetical protein